MNRDIDAMIADLKNKVLLVCLNENPDNPDVIYEKIQEVLTKAQSSHYGFLAQVQWRVIQQLPGTVMDWQKYLDPVCLAFAEQTYYGTLTVVAYVNGVDMEQISNYEQFYALQYPEWGAL